MKTYADAKVRAKTSSINIGDTVLARQRKHNKLSTRFDPLPFRAVRTNGTMITVRQNGKYITRNVSHFKVVDPVFQGEESNDEGEEDDDIASSLNSNSTSNVSNANMNPPQNELRRSTRNRKRVDHFGHYVYGQRFVLIFSLDYQFSVQVKGRCNVVGYCITSNTLLCDHL